MYPSLTSISPPVDEMLSVWPTLAMLHGHLSIHMTNVTYICSALRTARLNVTFPVCL